MTKAIFCTVKSSARAEDVVDRLKVAGFSNNDISVLMPDHKGTKDLEIDSHTKAPEGAVAGAGTGAVLGGALGWLTGIGALAIPGVGPLIAAGPIMAALSGVAVGGALGGLTGGLIGLGIPEYEAKRYEDRLKSGSVLISVHSENAEETDRAQEIFEAAGAEDIATSSEPADVAKRW